MRDSRRFLKTASALGLLAAGFAIRLWAADASPLVAIRNAKAFVGNGVVIEKATIVIRGGLIETIAASGAVPAGAQVVEAEGQFVYPGLIDALTDQGLKKPAKDLAPSSDTAGPQLAHLLAADQLDPDDRAFAPWREAGVLTLNVAPARGIFRGQTAVVNLNGGVPGRMLVRSPAWMRASFQGLGYRNRVPGMGEPGGEFPTRLIGVFGFVRQAFSDAQRADEIQKLLAASGGALRPERDPAIDALAVVARRGQPIVLPAQEEREVQRVLDLTDDFKLNTILAGGYQALPLAAPLKTRGIPVLVSLGFPEREKDVHPEFYEPVSYLGYRVHAPKAAGELVRAGVRIAFFSDGLTSGAEFLHNLRRAVREGLPQDAALRAATLTAAELLGVDKQLGSLAPGKAANLVVSDGDLFADESRIVQVFVDGRRFDVAKPGAPRAAAAAQAPRPASVASPGFSVPASTPREFLLKNANLMTVTHGTLKNAQILVRDGKIAAVGTDVSAAAGIVAIDATGKWVTPGFIDCHSHIATDSHNESGANVTSLTGIYDVINPNDIAVWRTLGAGVTTANTLHGSVNAIGGKTVVTKTRFGKPVPEFVFKGAKPGMKFAVKEFGPRRGATPPSSWMGMDAFLRAQLEKAKAYAQDWDDFTRAKKGPRTGLFPLLPPRRDLAMEPLVEAMRGQRLVHVHSYTVQEMLLVMRVAEDYGFRVVLQHATEAYKIADEIKQHAGGGASIFADLGGAGSMAGLYNAAILTRKGVPVSINSDGEELARHFNQDAARALKLGDLSEDQALALVTLNPAIQLQIDKQVGSIDVGKDADLVVFSAYPLSVYAVPEQVYIDGQLYYSRDLERERVRRAQEDGKRWIAIDEAERKLLDAVRGGKP